MTVFYIGALAGQTETSLAVVGVGSSMPSAGDAVALARTAVERVRSVQNAT
jgi:hypothetical protein